MNTQVPNNLQLKENNNLLSKGDWVETNDGDFYKVLGLDSRGFVTYSGCINKNEIKSVYTEIPLNQTQP